MAAVPPGPPRVLRRELFTAFLGIALSGIGGVMPHAHRMLVSRKRWLDDREFTEILSAGQFLPGPNIVNVGIIIGARMCGPTGAMAAFAGLVMVPFFIVLALGMAYEQLAALPWIAPAFRGLSCGAAGLVLAMAIKLGAAQPRHLWMVAIALAAFAAVGIMQWPLAPVVVALAALGLACAWRWRK